MTSRALAPVFAALACACSVSGQVGSRYLDSAILSPSSGGAIAVASSESASLAGASLTLPSGALASSTLIGVAPGASLVSGDWVSAGPSAEWDPAGTSLLEPAELLLPAQLPTSVSPGDLTVLSDGPMGLERIYGAQLQYDPQSGLVRFSALHLGTFQAAVGKPCVDRDGCAPGDLCEHGQCLPPDNGDAGPPP